MNKDPTQQRKEKSLAFKMNPEAKSFIPYSKSNPIISAEDISPIFFSGEGVIDLTKLKLLTIKQMNNPLLGYLNINHLRNKIVELRPVIQDLEFTILAIAETKLDDSFSSAQFRVNGYYCPSEFRKDRIKGAGGGLLLYVKKGIPCKRLMNFEAQGIETIVVEIHIGKQKWCIIAIYRNEGVKVKDFLGALSKSLDLLLSKYENVIILGDINIDSNQKNIKRDPQNKKSKFEKLSTLCETFDLTNKIKDDTMLSDKPTYVN